jgi:small subunit ribosomal protein S17
MEQPDSEPTPDAPAGNAAEAPADDSTAPAKTAERNARKERVGLVTSSKMDKTITVQVRRQMRHPMYGKYLERSSKMMVHDEHNDAGEGDTVRIMETRPISKNKRWRLVEIIERAK